VNFFSIISVSTDRIETRLFAKTTPTTKINNRLLRRLCALTDPDTNKRIDCVPVRTRTQGYQDNRSEVFIAIENRSERIGKTGVIGKKTGVVNDKLP
jgi:hypothetical protein